MNFTAQEIANIIKGTIIGNPNLQVDSVAKIENGTNGNLCFLANEKYKNHIYTTNASIIIINRSLVLEKEVRATLIKVDDAYSSFSQLLEVYNKMKFDKIGISEKADISDLSTIGENTYIGSFSTISERVKIGKNVKKYG